MHLQPSSRQGELIALARRLACDRFAPRPARHDCAASFPFDDYADLHAEGLLSLCVPERYGGFGADYETYCLVAEQLAQGNASTALTFNMHCLTMLMMGPIADSMPMSPTVRERHEKLRAATFREVVEEGAFYGQPHSEPVEQGETDTRLGAGGRRFGTTARKVDGGYVVNGRKFFVSLAGCAPYYATPAIRLGEEPWIERTLYLEIPKDAPGVSFPGEWDPMGCAPQSVATWCSRTCCPRRRGGAAARPVRGDVQRLPPPLPELLRDFPRAHASGLRRCPRLPDRPDAGRADPAHRDRGKGSCDSRDALCDRIRPRTLLPGNLGGQGRCSAGGGPARPRGARHRATRGSHSHPGGDPCLWRTGLPQALSARGLRTRG